jgi:hypothetical protein
MPSPAANGVNRIASHLEEANPDGDGQGVPGCATRPEPEPVGRDAHGRFARGNTGGPGNPFARRVAGLRRALLEAVSEEDLQAIARALVARAREGDTAAAKLLFQYVLGKPAEAVDPDTLDLKEWQLYQQRPVAGEELLRVLTQFPVDLACEILRAALPGVSQGMAQLATKLFARKEAEASHRATAAGRWRREATETAAADAEPISGEEVSGGSDAEDEGDQSADDDTQPEAGEPQDSSPAAADAAELVAALATIPLARAEDEAGRLRLLQVLGTLRGGPGPEPTPDAPSANGGNGDPPADPEPPSGNGGNGGPCRAGPESPALPSG